MADCFIKGLGAALLLTSLLTLSACARPVGDFGRAQPGVLHDEIMPRFGKVRATLSKEPVSRFNLTDQEQEMHDRIWRFLTAPHAEDWFHDSMVELQRTRLTTARDGKFKPDRYYRWLKKTDYASSRVRYATVADHIRSDIDTIPATFRAICAVLEIDRRRGVASADLRLEEPDTAARRAENHATIDWFVRALDYRYQSYSWGLDNLLVETPHEEARGVNALLNELAGYNGEAQRGDFCRSHGYGHGADVPIIPGRVLMPAKGEGDYLK